MGYLLGWFYDVYYGPVYDGGYYYEINGEWKWFPMRNWELERRDKHGK